MLTSSPTLSAISISISTVPAKDTIVDCSSLPALPAACRTGAVYRIQKAFCTAGGAGGCAQRRSSGDHAGQCGHVLLYDILDLGNYKTVNGIAWG